LSGAPDGKKPSGREAPKEKKTETTTPKSPPTTGAKEELLEQTPTPSKDNGTKAPSTTPKATSPKASPPRKGNQQHRKKNVSPSGPAQDGKTGNRRSPSPEKEKAHKAQPRWKAAGSQHRKAKEAKGKEGKDGKDGKTYNQAAAEARPPVFTIAEFPELPSPKGKAQE